MRKLLQTPFLVWILNGFEEQKNELSWLELHGHVSDINRNIELIEPQHCTLMLTLAFMSPSFVKVLMKTPGGKQALLKLLRRADLSRPLKLNELNGIECPISMSAITEEFGLVYMTEDGVIKLLSSVSMLKQILALSNYQGLCPLTKVRISYFLPLRHFSPEDRSCIIEIAKNQSYKEELSDDRLRELTESFFPIDKAKSFITTDIFNRIYNCEQVPLYVLTGCPEGIKLLQNLLEEDREAFTKAMTKEALSAAVADETSKGVTPIHRLAFSEKGCELILTWFISHKESFFKAVTKDTLGKEILAKGNFEGATPLHMITAKESGLDLLKEWALKDIKSFKAVMTKENLTKVASGFGPYKGKTPLYFIMQTHPGVQLLSDWWSKDSGSLSQIMTPEVLHKEPAVHEPNKESILFDSLMASDAGIVLLTKLMDEDLEGFKSIMTTEVLKRSTKKPLSSLRLLSSFRSKTWIEHLTHDRFGKKLLCKWLKLDSASLSKVVSAVPKAKDKLIPLLNDKQAKALLLKPAEQEKIGQLPLGGSSSRSKSTLYPKNALTNFVIRKKNHKRSLGEASKTDETGDAAAEASGAEESDAKRQTLGRKN